MNNEAAKLVADIRAMNGKMTMMRMDLVRLAEEYQARGGRNFIHLFWLDDAGQPRTDLEMTEDRIVDSLAAIAQVNTLLATHKATFVLGT